MPDPEDRQVAPESPVREIAPDGAEGPPAPGIALCLSGGGYRAMIFHVGMLWRLNEAGYLPRLARISSVSGGSITAGVLGLEVVALDVRRGQVAHGFERRGGRSPPRARRPHHRRRRHRGRGGAARRQRRRAGRGRLSRAPLRRRHPAGAARSSRASSSTPPTCSRARSGASPSRTWPTIASGACPSRPCRWPGGGRLVGVSPVLSPVELELRAQDCEAPAAAAGSARTSPSPPRWC